MAKSKSVATMEHPRYKHDCDTCVYLGSIDYPAPHWTKERGDYCVYKHADLYYCAESDLSMGGTVIARLSSSGPNYSSMPIVLLQKIVDYNATQFLCEPPTTGPRYSTAMPALQVALLFAKVKKLIP